MCRSWSSNSPKWVGCALVVATCIAAASILGGGRAGDAAPAASPVHGVAPTKSDQVVVVSAPAWNDPSATLTAFAWDGSFWQPSFGPVSAGIGGNGFTQTPKEADGYTPVGEYAFTMLFGSASNPGTSFPYVQTTSNDHWVDDPGSALYNTYQRGDAAGRWGSAESLADYAYAAAFDFNQNPVVAGGNSAIFLHSGGGPTPGCVEIDESDLLHVLRWLTPAAHPTIVLGVNAAPPPHIASASAAPPTTKPAPTTTRPRPTTTTSTPPTTAAPPTTDAQAVSAAVEPAVDMRSVAIQTASTPSSATVGGEPSLATETALWTAIAGGALLLVLLVAARGPLARWARRYRR